MDRLEAMTLLVLTVDRGSFSAAAREMRMPLATLSRKVSDLEAHIGTRLLVRTTRKLALTEAGIVYVAAARRILEQVADQERAAAGEYQAPRGELSLTAPVLFGRLHVLPIVADFLAAYPQIDIGLQLSDRNLHLIDDHIDMAVRIGSLPDSTMVATRVGTMRTVVAASPALLAAHGTPKAPQDLTTMPCVGFQSPSQASSWTFNTGHDGKVLEVPVHQRLTVTAAEAAVAAAIAGVGTTRVLHYQCGDAVAAGSLRLVLEDFEPEPMPVHLVHAARGTMPLKMRAFLDFAAPRLRQHLSHLAEGGRGQPQSQSGANAG